MIGTANNDQCCHRPDAIAYLYDEMPAADRERFEMHLPDCAGCIEEFAWLSQSRYPVYEWKQIEFDPLPTPSITIPYAAAGSGWFAILKAAFASRPSLSLAGGFAMIVFAGMIGFAIVNFPTTDIEVANVVVKQEPQPTPDLVSPEMPAAGAVSPEPLPVKEAAPDVSRAQRRAPQPRHARPALVPKRTPERKEGLTAVNPRDLPSLLQADEAEDDSLRLSDIFEEVGTIE